MRYDALCWLPPKTNKQTIPISFIHSVHYQGVFFQMTVTAVPAFVVLCYFATLSVSSTTLQFPHKTAACSVVVTGFPPVEGGHSAYL